MRNDIWFRVHYPYGIVLDVENGAFALFNRFYKRLGEGRDVEHVYKTIPQLLKFIPNKHVNEELRKKLEMLAAKNEPSMSCGVIEEHYFRVWLYNDGTNPYAYAKRHTRHYNRYKELLFEVSQMLGVDLNNEIIAL